MHSCKCISTHIFWKLLFSEFSRPKKKNLKFSLKIQKKKIHSSKLEKFFKIPTQFCYVIKRSFLIHPNLLVVPLMTNCCLLLLYAPH